MSDKKKLDEDIAPDRRNDNKNYWDAEIMVRGLAGMDRPHLVEFRDWAINKIVEMTDDQKLYASPYKARLKMSRRKK